MKQEIAIVSIEWDVVDLIESCGRFSIVGFFDVSAERCSGEIRYLGSDDAWPQVKLKMPNMKIALAIDNPNARKRLFGHYGDAAIVTLCSPAAYVSSRAVFGHGTIMQRGVTVMPNARIGLSCKLNLNATIHHDAKVGDFTTIAPGAQLLGNVTIEECAYVGAGAVVRQHCCVGAGALIGAGAVVVRDIPAGAVVVGVPAQRRLK